jgi:hypothetical protein
VNIVNGVPVSNSVNLSGMTDGLVTATLSVSDAAGNTFGATGSAQLDQDLGENPSVLVNGGSTTPIGKAGASAVPFAVGGLASDDSGTLTFSDGTNSVTVTITNGQVVAGAHNTATTVDLSGLADGVTITSSLSVSDPAGNPFTRSGNGVTLAAAETPPDLLASFSGLVNGHVVEGTPVTATVWDDVNVTSSAHYTWQVSTDGGNTWTTVGTDSSMFTPGEEGGQLRVLISFTEPANESNVVDTIIKTLGTIAEQVPTLTATETAPGSNQTQTNTDFVLVDKGTAVQLNLSLGNVDPDGSATMTINGLPSNVTLTYVDANGQTQSLPINAAGSVTLTQAELNSLTLHTPTNTSELITLSVMASNTEGGTTVTSALETLMIDVSSQQAIWKNASDGDFATVSNWRGAPPNSTTDDIIDLSGTYTVTIGASNAGNSLTINNAGTTVVDGTGDSLTLTTGLVLDAGTFQLAGGILSAGSIFTNGGTISGFGTISGAVLSFAKITDSGGSLSGSLSIHSGATLELAGASAENVSFANNAGVTGTLMLDNPNAYSGTISGFAGTTGTQSDAIDLKGIAFDPGTTWTYTPTSSTRGTLTIFENGIAVDTIAFATPSGSPLTTDNFQLTGDGSGGTLITDPPASTTTPNATVTPVVETTMLTTTETTGSQTDVTSATVDDGTVVALNTAVSDPDGGQMTNVTSGNGTVVDATGTVSESASFTVNFGATLESSSISHEIVGTLTDNGTVEVTNDKLEIAGTASGTGVFKIDAGATLQLDGPDAINVTFAGSNATLILDHSLTQPFSAVISGLGAHDTIDLNHLTFTNGDMTASASLLVNGNTALVVSNTSTEQSVTLTLAGDYTHSTWHFAQDSSATGTILSDPPATDTNALHLNVPGSASTDLALTVKAALTSPDQFAFQGDSHSGTLAIGSTSIASGKDASATDAVTLDTTASSSSAHQPTATATTDGSADSGLTSNVATNSQPTTGDSTSNDTQAGTMAQTASASPAANSDTFVFAANFGNATVTNFHPETDVIEIDHKVFADFQALLAATHDDGHGSAVITADPHHSITIENVTVAQLVQHQGDFHFT